jgi:hypothetical protein
MDPWKELSAWETGRDSLRKWAALEGKSAAMSDHLVQGQVAREPLSDRPLKLLNRSAHVGVWIAEIWRLFRRG